MQSIIQRNVMSCIVAALAASLLAGPLWVLIGAPGNFTTSLSELLQAFAVSYVIVMPMAAIMGVALAVALGAPVMIGLERLGKRTPARSGLAGAIVAPLPFLAWLPHGDASTPAALAYLAIMGGLTGAFASWLSARRAAP